jgi:septal ring factor EnvC (AmiA/AmiB activator)
MLKTQAREGFSIDMATILPVSGLEEETGKTLSRKEVFPLPVVGPTTAERARSPQHSMKRGSSMNIVKVSVVVCAVAFALAGCGSGLDKQVTQLSETVQKLEKQVTQSQEAIAKVEKQGASMKADLDKELVTIKAAIKGMEQQVAQAKQAIPKPEEVTSSLKGYLDKELGLVKGAVKKLEEDLSKAKEGAAKPPQQGAPPKPTTP